MKRGLPILIICLFFVRASAQDRFSSEVNKTLRMLEKQITISDCDRPEESNQMVIYTILIDTIGGISKVNYLSFPDNICQKEINRVSCLLKKEWTPIKTDYTMILIPVFLIFPDSESADISNNLIAEKLNLFFLRNSQNFKSPDILLTRPLSITYYRVSKNSSD